MSLNFCVTTFHHLLLNFNTCLILISPICNYHLGLSLCLSYFYLIINTEFCFLYYIISLFFWFSFDSTINPYVICAAYIDMAIFTDELSNSLRIILQHRLKNPVRKHLITLHFLSCCICLICYIQLFVPNK